VSSEVLRFSAARRDFYRGREQEKYPAGAGAKILGDELPGLKSGSFYRRTRSMLIVEPFDVTGSRIFYRGRKEEKCPAGAWQRSFCGHNV